MHQHRFALIALGFGILLSGACAQDPELDPFGNARAPLLVDTDGDGVANDGVIFHGDMEATQVLVVPGNTCTATYLERCPGDPPMVATAAHCVQDIDVSDTSRLSHNKSFPHFLVVYDTPANPSSARGATFTDQLQRFHIKDIHYSPGWNVTTKRPYRSDVALVELEDVPLRFDAASGTFVELEGVKFLGRTPTVSDSYLAVGQGRTGDTDGEGTLPSGTRRKGAIFDPDTIEPDGITRFWHATNKVVGGAQVRDGGAHGGPGDSGGPLYVEDGGEFKIAGILSSTSTSENFYTTLDYDNTTYASVFDHPSSSNASFIANNRHGRCGAGSFDGNNSWRSAVDLTSKAQTYTGAIDCVTDSDTFFLGTYSTTAVANMNLEIHFDDDAGDLDAKVYRATHDTHAPPKVDSLNEASVDLFHTMPGTGDVETMSKASVGADRSYYMKVYGHQGATNPYRIMRCEGDGRTNTSVSAAEPMSPTYVGQSWPSWGTCMGPNDNTNNYLRGVRAYAYANGRTACPSSPRFFRFTNRRGRTEVQVSFDNSKGDIDARILNLDGSSTGIVSYSSHMDVESFTWDALQNLSDNQDYVLEVFAYQGQGATANTFNVEIDSSLYIHTVELLGVDPITDTLDIRFQTNKPAYTKCVAPANAIAPQAWSAQTVTHCSNFSFIEDRSALQTIHYCEVGVDFSGFPGLASYLVQATTTPNSLLEGVSSCTSAAPTCFNTSTH